jgi:hypothetical protein
MRWYVIKYGNESRQTTSRKLHNTMTCLQRTCSTRSMPVAQSCTTLTVRSVVCPLIRMYVCLETEHVENVTAYKDRGFKCNILEVRRVYQQSV